VIWKIHFYNTDELNLDEKASMFKDRIKFNYEWWADKIDRPVPIYWFGVSY
jgi:hypothetical protein